MCWHNEMSHVAVLCRRGLQAVHALPAIAARELAAAQGGASEFNTESRSSFTNKVGGCRCGAMGCLCSLLGNVVHSRQPRRHRREFSQRCDVPACTRTALAARFSLMMVTLACTGVKRTMPCLNVPSVCRSFIAWLPSERAFTPKQGEVCPATLLSMAHQSYGRKASSTRAAATVAHEGHIHMIDHGLEVQCTCAPSHHGELRTHSSLTLPCVQVDARTSAQSRGGRRAYQFVRVSEEGHVLYKASAKEQ